MELEINVQNSLNVLIHQLGNNFFQKKKKEKKKAATYKTTKKLNKGSENQNTDQNDQEVLQMNNMAICTTSTPLTFDTTKLTLGRREREGEGVSS